MAGGSISGNKLFPYMHLTWHTFPADKSKIRNVLNINVNPLLPSYFMFIFNLKSMLIFSYQIFLDKPLPGRAGGTCHHHPHLLQDQDHQDPVQPAGDGVDPV